jgi:hypothetical protein
VPVWSSIVFAALLLAALIFAARRATTVLEMRVHRGRVQAQRGRAPGELLRDLHDIFARAEVTGRLVLRLEDGGISVHAPDFGPDAQQQIRNVVGRFPPARLKTAPRVR